MTSQAHCFPSAQVFGQSELWLCAYTVSPSAAKFMTTCYSSILTFIMLKLHIYSNTQNIKHLVTKKGVYCLGETVQPSFYAPVPPKD